MFDIENFSLVLSGGAALGIGHLGIIKYFQENKIVPKEIIGTSMGALLGAAYAKGLYYDEIISILKKLNYLKLFRFNILRRNALIDLKQIKLLLYEIFGDESFNSLKIDLKIIVSDIETGKATVFDKDNNIKLVDALCASFAIPGIFEAYEIEKNLYWDGFLTSNLPIEFASNEKIVAVDVVNLSLIQNRDTSTIKSSLEKSFFISILNQTESKINDFSNIYLINLDMSKFNLYDFHKWEEIIEISYKQFKTKYTS